MYAGHEISMKKDYSDLLKVYCLRLKKRIDRFIKVKIDLCQDSYRSKM